MLGDGFAGEPDTRLAVGVGHAVLIGCRLAVEGAYILRGPPRLFELPIHKLFCFELGEIASLACLSFVELGVQGGEEGAAVSVVVVDVRHWLLVVLVVVCELVAHQG